MDRGWESIVGALPHVDVIVGMDRFVFAKAITTGHLDCAIADDFVDVHIARSARAGLKNVDGELIREFAGGDFFGCGK